MRNEFAKITLELANQDSNLVLLSGDIGNRLFDDFKNHHPNNFYNCGIAEANMITMAAGMSSMGIKPIVYTITPFITYRCYEQIRVDVCYQNNPVIIVGTGSGLAYSELGATHHSLEDIAVMRALPNMNVFVPCDKYELKNVYEYAFNLNEPCYIRMGKKDNFEINSEYLKSGAPDMSILRKGKDVCIISSGPIISEAIQACETLNKEGIYPELVSFPVLKPFDQEKIKNYLDKFSFLITLEDHSIIGGLWSSIADVIARLNINIKSYPLATNDKFLHEIGSENYARKQYKINNESICNLIKKILK